jgi:hypothetical protein
MAQPKKKTPITKKSTISDLKAKMGISVSVDKGNIEGASNADKEMEWLIMPKAFQDAVKLPGFPCGYVSTICGHSNTGKSTLINHAIVAAQRQNTIPIIYDTENNFDFNYAIDMGFNAEPVYGVVEEEDPETGEVREVEKIIEWTGDFFYFNSAILREMYGDIDYSTGKKGGKKRITAVIEDMAYSIKSFLEMQENGELPYNLLFVWDSIGSIGGLKSYNSKVGNNMFDAGTISVALQDIMESLIPGSRKVSSKYTNTMIVVNKVWTDSTTNPVGPPSLELKGGKSVTYRSRLIFLLGGQLKASIKRLTATSKGLNYNWGILTKIKVLKNQLPSPYDLTYEGEFICTGFGIIGSSKEEQDEFKKTKVPLAMKRILERNNSEIQDIGNISFGETVEDGVSIE